MTLKQSTLDKLEALKEKFDNRGQDVDAYLDGLMESEFLSYWEYVHLETLLSLQTPRTQYPDEEIFIMYHQISELYFKLCLHELKQLTKPEAVSESVLLNKLKRLNNYFKALIGSYEIMVDGMDKEQFLKFRMALLPASGFQSAQFRKIAFYSTHLKNLANGFGGNNLPADSSMETFYDEVYWKRGAIDLKTGQKTLTLKQFEDRYDKELLELANSMENVNLNNKIEALDLNAELIAELKKFDVQANINWPLSHYKSAVRYLKKDPVNVEATGGTNWQSYLPPKFQKVSFFPTIWTDTELSEWGKSWVESI